MTSERSEQRFVGRINEDGLYSLVVSSSRDITRFVRGDARSLSEIDRITFENGLCIVNIGSGSFRLEALTPDSIREFLQDKRFQVGSRSFRKGDFVPLPERPQNQGS